MSPDSNIVPPHPPDVSKVQESFAASVTPHSRVLIITYYWPPGSGAGVQRWLKFTKYLPSLGWEPYVLTVDPAYATYPSTDTSLNDDISPDLKIFRTKATDWFRIYKKDKSKIPSAGFAANDRKNLASKVIRFLRGNFFIPDPRKGWNKYAYRKASELIKSEGITQVVTTSPPHSTQLIGLEIKKKYPQIRWIADLRDPWTEIYYYDSFLHTSIAKKADMRYEMEVLRKADRIITVGKSLKDSFTNRVQGIENKTEIITNGYDREDFLSVTHVKPDIFTISYIGTLSDAYPVSSLMDALNAMTAKDYKILLRFVGAVSADQRSRILSAAGNTSIEFIPYVEHADAISYMACSSLLLLIIPAHHSNKCILTGKLFEYLAASRPVLCIGPEDGDAAGILSLTGHGRCAGYNDSGGIRRIIEEFYNQDSQATLTPPDEYNRQNLTARLAAVLNSIQGPVISSQP